MERTAVELENELTERKPDEQWRVWLASAVEQTTDSVIITDFSFTVVRYVNQAFLNLTGYAREEVIGRGREGLREYLEEGSNYEEIQEAVAQGRTWLGRLTVRPRDGGELEVESTLSPIRDDSGRVINYVAVMRDITRYTELERQLQQSQKMEAIGALASGIAHDFNNLLWAITGYAEMALEEAPADSEVQDNLRQLLKASRRAKDLVEQILTFSRQSGQDKSHLVLGVVVKEALKLIRATLPSTIDIRQEIQMEGSFVQANATQIHQVMMNLCSNAAYAMRENGGVLTVTLQPVEIDPAVAAGHPDLSPGPHFRLSVADTGHGMDHAPIQRIFEPFFTTKNPGEGTGMGLAAVNGIVKGHGGAVTVESALGRGSVFHVFLPRAEEGVPAEEDPLKYIPSGNERILFVDDEEILVDMA
ncbi:MAG: ATP-binding protein, partial [Pseudomonadota bacterium]